MRCWKCGNDNYEDTKFCLYCGISMERTSPVSDLGKALRKIYDDFGHEAVFKDSRCLSSSLSDLISDSELFVYSIEHVYRVGLGSVYESQISKVGKTDESFYTRVKRIITVDAGLSESKADELISLFDEMIGWQVLGKQKQFNTNTRTVESRPKDVIRSKEPAKPHTERQYVPEKPVSYEAVSSNDPVGNSLPEKIEGTSLIISFTIMIVSCAVLFFGFQVINAVIMGLFLVLGLIMSFLYYAGIRKGDYSYSLVNAIRVPTIVLIIWGSISLTIETTNLVNPKPYTVPSMILSGIVIIISIFILVKLKINNNLSLELPDSQSSSRAKTVSHSAKTSENSFMDVGFYLGKKKVTALVREFGFQKGYIEFKDGSLIVHSGSQTGSAGNAFLFGFIGATLISSNKDKMDVLIRVSKDMIKSADIINENDRKYVLIRMSDKELAVSGPDDVVYRTYYWAKD